MQSSRNQHQKDSNVQPSKSRKKEEKKREENHNFDFINFRILIRLTKKKNKTHFSSINQGKKIIIHCPIN